MTIHMSADHVRHALHYCPETGVMTWLRPSKFHVEKAGAEAGGPMPSQSGKLYHKISLGGRRYSRSRLAHLIMTGEWPSDCIDHINGNSLDDRWENLRSATVTQNAWNHKGRAKRSDLPMGVRIANSGRYVARIGFKKKLITIGTFDAVEDAAAAYNAKRQELFGEFA